eukprot:Partr_v1_DN25278_c0_g1_i1_m16581 putative tRNA methyltransferase 44 homolog (S. cerevisiae)
MEIHRKLTRVISEDLFQHIVGIYIRNPEIFNVASIVRADISLNADGEIERTLIPKLKRKWPNVCRQLVTVTAKCVDISILSDVSLQFFYPAISKLQISLIDGDVLSMEWLDPSAGVEEIVKNRTVEYFNSQLLTLCKYIEKEIESDSRYVKRVNHDIIVSRSQYQDFYYALKEELCPAILDMWLESQMATDAQKHVHEDLGIASFMVLLFCQSSTSYTRGCDLDGMKRVLDRVDKEINFELHNLDYSSLGDTSFIDMGCGNGLLVWILASLGISGYGLDIWKRPLWQHLSSSNLKCQLKVETVTPNFEVDMESLNGKKNIW